MTDEVIVLAAWQARIDQLNTMLDMAEACAQRGAWRVGKAILEQSEIVKRRCVELKAMVA